VFEINGHRGQGEDEHRHELAFDPVRGVSLVKHMRGRDEVGTTVALRAGLRCRLLDDLALLGRRGSCNTGL